MYVPKRGKIYHTYVLPLNAPKGSNKFQLAKEYILSKARQNLPKLGCLVWKHTIWQPCFHDHFFCFHLKSADKDKRLVFCKRFSDIRGKGLASVAATFFSGKLTKIVKK
jgi:hypothetical protein